MMKQILILTFIFANFAFNDTFLPKDEQTIMTSVYDESMGRDFWYYATASYCRASKIEAWNCNWACTSPKIQDIQIFYNKTGANFGFMGFNIARNHITVVFRGTLPWLIKNWISDIDFFKTQYPDCDGCQVHRGFYYSYLQIRDQVFSGLQALKAKYPKAKVTIIGHSLGGAIATHTLVDFIKNGINVDFFYTFGSPRVGDDQFRFYVKNLYPGFKARVVNKHDPVPHLPMDIQGFAHISTEVYYYESWFKTYHRTCDDDIKEDPSCSNQNLLDLDIDNHIHYYDLDQLIQVPICQ